MKVDTLPKIKGISTNQDIPTQMKKTVVKANVLARANWSAVSVWEGRIVALLASKILPSDDEFQTYIIPITEIIQNHSFGGTTYEEIFRACYHLMQQVLFIDDPNGKRRTMYTFLDKCTVDAENATVELCFHRDLKSYFLQLRSQFTKYSLTEFFQLPSIYSQKLYELLNSWSNTGEVEFQINYLYDKLDVPASVRRDFTNFKTRVLEVAHSNISDKTNFFYEWEPIKQGKKRVAAIRFFFTRDRHTKFLEEQNNQQHACKLAEVHKLHELSKKCRIKLQQTAGTCVPKKYSAKCDYCVSKQLNLSIGTYIQKELL